MTGDNMLSCVSQPPDSGSVRKLLTDTETLRQILEEADSLLQMFWRAALPNVEETKQVRTNMKCNTCKHQETDGFSLRSVSHSD